MKQPEMMDAYTRPRRVAPGCTHQLGCRCDAPFWLRPPTPIEEARAEHMLDQAGRAAGGIYRASLPELAENLRELRERYLNGRANEACAEFFALYVFSNAP